MNNKIYVNHTLEEYKKKYGNKNLKKVNKADFTKNKSLLNDRSWWLINNTYYEIPSNNGFKSWWHNLGKGGQIALCTLLGVCVATAVIVPTVVTLNKNSGFAYYNIMKTSKADFEDKNKTIGPAIQEDYNSTAYISKEDDQKGKGGAIANKALTDGYYNLFEKNENYLKQDIMYALTNTINSYKTKIDIPLIGTVVNLNGDLELKISDLRLSKDVLNEDDNPHYLVCSFVGEYKSKLSADIEFISGEKYEISTDLSGKLEYSNLFITLEPQAKSSGTNPSIWSNFNFKIWSSTHNARGGAISSSLKSYANGSTIVKEKGQTSKSIYTRVDSEPKFYIDPNYPSIFDYEILYKDPICFLVSSINEDISYSCKNIYLPIINIID